MLTRGDWNGQVAANPDPRQPLTVEMHDRDVRIADAEQSLRTVDIEQRSARRRLAGFRSEIWTGGHAADEQQRARYDGRNDGAQGGIGTTRKTGVFLFFFS